MADNFPIVRTNINTELISLRNQARTIVWGLVACTKSFGSVAVGDIYTFTSYEQAKTTLGNDQSLNNDALDKIAIIYKLNPYSIVKFCYMGQNVAGATTTINNVAGYKAGAKVITLTGVPVLNSMISINAGTEFEQIRKVLAVTGNDATILPLDFDIANLDTVTTITEPNRAVNLPLCRTALLSEEFRIYCEDSYGATNMSAVKDMIELLSTGRDDNDLYTQAFFGFDQGTTRATAITTSQLINSKYINTVYSYGKDLKLKTRTGSFTAVVLASRFAQELSAYNPLNRVVITLNDLSLKDIFIDVKNMDDGSAILAKQCQALNNGNVSALIISAVSGKVEPVVYKMLTTYNLDAGSLPDRTYTFIADPNIDILLREVMNREIKNFLRKQIENKNPINQNNIKLLTKKAQQVVNDLDIFDRNTDNGGFDPVVSGQFDLIDQGRYNLSFSFRGIDSIDRVFITGYKID